MLFLSVVLRPFTFSPTIVTFFIAHSLNSIFLAEVEVRDAGVVVTVVTRSLLEEMIWLLEVRPSVCIIVVLVPGVVLVWLLISITFVFALVVMKCTMLVIIVVVVVVVVVVATSA